MLTLEGKVCVITGAAGKIGIGTIKALAEAGAKVVASDMDGARLAEVVARFKGEGHDVAGCRADVSSEDDVRALVDFTVKTYGRLDVVDNNAGATHLVVHDRDFLNMSVDIWDQMHAINSRGPMLLCKHAIPHMLAQGGGSIVNISSGQSLGGDLMSFAYAASKASVNAMTRHIATTYGPSGIRCNTIAPGLIAGEGGEHRMSKEVLQMFCDNTPIPRIGVASDIANAVVFLASDLSAYITGQVISVDGGILIPVPTVGSVRKMLAAGASALKSSEPA